MSIEHPCVICQKMITGLNETDFEKHWEDHRATHPITLTQPKGSEVHCPVCDKVFLGKNPDAINRERLFEHIKEAHNQISDAQLADMQRRLDANEAIELDSGKLEVPKGNDDAAPGPVEGQKPIPLDDRGGVGTRYKNEQDHEEDLARHYEGVSRVEHRLPQLIDFAFKLAQRVGNFAKEKGIPTRKLSSGNIAWTPDGDIAIEIGYDPNDVQDKVAPAFLKTGYARLPTLQKHYPCVFEPMLTVGHHLCNMIDMKKVTAKEIQLSNLHHFVNRWGVNMFAFRLYRKGGALKPGRAQM